MAIKFKKQIARTPSGNLVTPEEKITTAQLNAVEKEYKKSDHFKHKSKSTKSKR